MPRSNWFGTAIFVFAVVFILAGLVFIKWPDFQHKADVNRVLYQHSLGEATLQIDYAKPPVYREQYTLVDDNGVSSAVYRIQGYSGKVVTISLPPERTTDPSRNVGYFFEDITQNDQAWQLVNKPPVGNTDVRYTLHVHQIADNRQGSRTVVFTDPKYWAVTAGRQYHIQLSKNSPTPDLTKLQSTSLADPRYEKIVQAFRNFGPVSFRKKIAQAQALIRASH
ncbi:MAG TPA: hypothetical protein VFE17_10495 [Candidatus Baltobacteraceae bacterium]|jgi:hypothetical protein|nr:hypothetical protein [Candidatus Baltobacteraceae bacterium]